MARADSSSEHPKYSVSCFLHDGKAAGSQSDVTFKGRDRSKAGIMKKGRAKRKEMDEDEEGEGPPEFGTPKVYSCGPC